MKGETNGSDTRNHLIVLLSSSINHLPISPPFSNTTTLTSFPFSCSSCFRRMAVLKPAGPPPTMHTSTSSDARSTVFGSNTSRHRLGVQCRERKLRSTAWFRARARSMVKVRKQTGLWWSGKRSPVVVDGRGHVHVTNLFRFGANRSSVRMLLVNISSKLTVQKIITEHIDMCIPFRNATSVRLQITNWLKHGRLASSRLPKAFESNMTTLRQPLTLHLPGLRTQTHLPS